MEYLLFFVVTGLFLAGIFIREVISAKKEEKRCIQSLYTSYGSVPKREYSPERYAKIGSYAQKHKRREWLDDITWNDLNMDSIFKRINNTLSATGEEYLYYTLRDMGKSGEELAHLEEVIEYFDANAKERVYVQYQMKRLGYTGKYSLYDYIDNLDILGKRSNRKHILCNLLYVPLLSAAPFWLTFSLLGTAALMIYHILTYFKEKSEIDPYIISFSYILRLAVVSDELLSISVPVCEKEWEDMRRQRKTLKNMQRGSFWIFSANRGQAAGSPLDAVLDYVRMIFHVDLIKFNKMLSQLRTHTDDVDGLITVLGYLETAIAIGNFRRSLDTFCVPNFKEKKELCLLEAYHPLLNHPVKNSIRTDKGVLITGSNASGKSTFLKTVAVNAVLAQTIHTCAAEYYSAPYFAIYSSMALQDSLESGESYYIVEIKALKRIFQAGEDSGRKVLCFVDEVLRGTNTVERIAAATQILKSLGAAEFLCFAATHDIELTGLLKQSYTNYHFEEEIRDGDVVFNYQLMNGKAVTGNAIRLLEIMGYDKNIIEEAYRQAENFIQSGVWSA